MKTDLPVSVKTILLLLTCLLFGCSKNQVVANRPPHQFRVIGYLPIQQDVLAGANLIDYGKITHLNLAFVNPDSLGVLQKTANLKAVAAIAHSRNVKIMASIGGGSAPAYYHSFLIGEKQVKLIADLVDLAVKNDLDGIDVDLEGGLIDANYENFVINLATALRQKNKLITAAIATVYKDSFTDKALAQFDFVNIMSYDQTGPWNLSRPGPHSPYEMATQDLEYWTNKRGIAKEKLSLGVPFYGYGFGGQAPQSMSYKNILVQFPGSENKDQLDTAGGVLYYNGMTTIKNKTKLALEKSGGVMIWQLLQDTTGPNSLLLTIDSTIKEFNKK